MTQETNRSCVATNSLGPESLCHTSRNALRPGSLLQRRGSRGGQTKGGMSGRPAANEAQAKAGTVIGVAAILRRLGCLVPVPRLARRVSQWGALGHIIPTFPSVTEHQLDYTHYNSDVLMMSLAACHYFDFFLMTVPLTVWWEGLPVLH